MNTIEFKGKRIDNGEWVYGYFYPTMNIGDEWEYIIRGIGEQGGFTEHTIDPKTVGQYIGAKDKYGKKIYEGDRYRIIDSHPLDGGREMQRDTLFEVVFDACSFSATPIEVNQDIKYDGIGAYKKGEFYSLPIYGENKIHLL